MYIYNFHANVELEQIFALLASLLRWQDNLNASFMMTPRTRCYRRLPTLYTIQHARPLAGARAFALLKLNGQHNLDTHVLSLLHKLTVNQDLVGTNAVAHGICWVCGRRNLHLAPLTVGGYNLAGAHTFGVLLIHALLFNAAFTADEGRRRRGRHAQITNGAVEQHQRESLLLELVHRRSVYAVASSLEVAAGYNLERIANIDDERSRFVGDVVPLFIAAPDLQARDGDREQQGCEAEVSVAVHAEAFGCRLSGLLDWAKEGVAEVALASWTTV
jgi:hypothetical protein